MSENKARIAVMVSGGGTNLQALLDAQKAGKLPSGEIVLVIASNSKAYALERAKNAGVPGFAVSKKVNFCVKFKPVWLFFIFPRRVSTPTDLRALIFKAIAFVCVSNGNDTA